MVLFHVGSPSPHQCHRCHDTIQDVRSACVHGAICARRIDAGALFVRAMICQRAGPYSGAAYEPHGCPSVAFIASIAF